MNKNLIFPIIAMILLASIAHSEKKGDIERMALRHTTQTQIEAASPVNFLISKD